MKEHPILFSDAMVRAILDGTKTQTRRWVKPSPRWIVPDTGEWMVTIADMLRDCPYGVIGDRLWVREAHQAHWVDDQRPDLDFTESQGAGWLVRYRASDGLIDLHYEDKGVGAWCRPSIHMPRWASRITLELTDVRVERVQDISEEDARAEGCDAGKNMRDGSCRDLFSVLWDSINVARAPWVSNPWVWALTFKRGGA